MEKVAPIVSLVGRPNVGKSSLFNALLKKKQSLVSKVAGTTRDRHYDNLFFDDENFCHLIDTGGFFASENSNTPFYKELFAEVEKALEESDLILFVVDATVGLHPIDKEIVNLLRKKEKEFWLVINKVDHHSKENELFEFFSLTDKYFLTSTAHTKGIESLKDNIFHFIKELPHAGLPKIENSIAILGKPNVGKSTLLNALLGEKRAIVSDVAGTTLGPIEETFYIDQECYKIVDTAGLRRKSKVEDELEELSFNAALKTIEKVDLVLFIFDGFLEEISSHEKRLLDTILEQGKSLILCFNKMDLDVNKEKIEQELERASWLHFTEKVFFSAKYDNNLDSLKKTIKRVFKYLYQTVPINKVNTCIEDALLHYPQKSIKIKYSLQIKKKPPTFLCFCKKPELLDNNIKAYISNSLRKVLRYPSTPIRVFFREKA